MPEITSRSESTTVLVARQPIYNRDQQTTAYELLFRDAASDTTAQIESQERATAQVVVNSLLEFGLDRLVGKSTAFINVTRDFILSGHLDYLPKDRIIFEILEDTEPTPELLEALRRCVHRGYRFALDDYAFQPSLEAFLPFCRILKVDIRQVEQERLIRDLPDLLMRFPLRLLAEKVETPAEFALCKEAGFQFFQGYWFCRPNLVSGSTIPANRLSICRVLAELHQPDLSIHKLESIVSEDISLSYRLLRYINSASIALRKDTESIKHAVRLVGSEQIRMLASLIMLTSFDEAPRELATTSLVRARMCESLAGRLGLAPADRFFTVGLLSTLDAFLNCSMAEALALLPLEPAIQEALRTRSNDSGRMLQLVIAYERGEWGAVQIPGLQYADLRNAYLAALQWADSLVFTFTQSSGSN